MKYKTAIFDMDGTILNTLDDLTDSCNHILEKNGMPLHTIDEIRFFVGNGIPKLIERAVPAGTKAETQQKILAEFSEYYAAHSAEKTKPYPGIPELLQKLRRNGVATAVNTNKTESAAKVLCEDYFPGLFDFVSGGRPGVPKKPAPDGIYEIIRAMNADPAETVFIGDSDVDLQTGTNAGLNVIGVDWGFRGKKFLEEHGAKTVASDTDELFRLICGR